MGTRMAAAVVRIARDSTFFSLRRNVSAVEGGNLDYLV